jgi:hypothetical protein
MEFSYYAHETRLTEQTMLNCIDNSGASIVECVANLRMKRHAKIGTATVSQIYSASSNLHIHCHFFPCPEFFDGAGSSSCHRLSGRKTSPQWLLSSLMYTHICSSINHTSNLLLPPPSR